MMSSTPTRRRSVAYGIILTLIACDASDGALAPEIPPSAPTHHAIAEGVVRDASGAPLSAIAVGVRFAAASPPTCRASVVGGTVTGPDGSYHLVVQAIRPPSEGIAEFYVSAQVYGAPGARVRQDSVLASARFLPLDHAPLRVTVADLRIPPP
jgi:hypothetical protein